jgi:nucleoside-diphosphate-sugar epimerase
MDTVRSQKLGEVPESGGVTLCPALDDAVLADDRPDKGKNLEACRTIQTRSIAGFDSADVGGWERVVVTGGAGCIGSEVLQLLKRLNVPTVVSYSKGLPGSRKVLGVEYQIGDVLDPKTFGRLLTRVRPDLVIHLAAVRDPGRAERTVREAILTNVIGTQAVLDCARMAEVPTVVAASTGKAMRMYTSDVYASSKQLLEYQLARAAINGNMKTACARFTHVVDNSIISRRLKAWARANNPILLHGRNVDLFVQSAREASELILLSAKIARDNVKPGWIAAIKDLGWPPVDLFGLAQDYRDDLRSRSEIRAIGFPMGYEERPYPGTTDPQTAGDHTPLFSAIEAAKAIVPAGIPESVEATPMLRTSEAVDHALRIIGSTAYGHDPAALRDALSDACRAYLRLKLECAPPEVLTGMAKRGNSYERFTPDHVVAHDAVTDYIAALQREEIQFGKYAEAIPG